MKHLNIVVAAVLSLSAVSAAQGHATDGWYIAPSVGVNFFHDTKVGLGELELDPGFSVGAMVGRKLPDLPLRFEVGVDYHRAAVKDTDGDVTLSATVPRVNGWVEIPVFGEGIIPYVGAGLGAANTAANVEMSGTTASISEWYFTWQAGAGVGMSITDYFVFDVGYRYGHLVDSGDDGDEDLSFSRIDVTARFMF